MPPVRCASRHTPRVIRSASDGAWDVARPMLAAPDSSLTYYTNILTRHSRSAMNILSSAQVCLCLCLSLSTLAERE